MKKTRLLFSLLMAVVVMAMSPAKVWATDYQVGTTSQWNSVMSELNSVSSSTTANVYLTGDFTVTSPAEISSKVTMHLYGQKHTITLNLESTSEYTGLFRKLYGGEISDLWLKGKITTNKKYLGSVCGQTASNTVSLTKIYSEVTLYSLVDGDATAGGLVGEANTTTKVTACGFVGKLKGTVDKNGDDVTDKMCGLIGYNSDVEVSFTSCYQAAEWLNVKSGDNYAFMRNDDKVMNSKRTTYSRCFYLGYGPGGKVSDKGTSGATPQATAAEFKSGYVTYGLNGDGTYFYQNIDKGTPDDYPIPFSSHNVVYYSYTHGSNEYNGYTNVNNVKHQYYDNVISETWTNDGTPDQCRLTVKLGCSVCDLTVTETIVPAYVSHDATCTGNGGYTYEATSTKYKHYTNLYGLMYYYFTHSWMGISAKGHGYSKGYTKNYTWAGQSYSDVGTCQGVTKCNDCGAGVESVALTMASKSVTTSTCTTQGVRVWSASGKTSIAGQAAYSAESDEYKDALKDHGYSKGLTKSYKWHDQTYNYAGSCFGTTLCEDCGTKIEKDEQLTVESNTYSSPTCTTEGVRTWKATRTSKYGDDFYAISAEYTTPALGHSYSDETSACTTCNTYRYGDGSSSNPYLISKAGELAWFRDQVNTVVVVDGNNTFPYQFSHAQLTDDIDLSSLTGNWTPIGTEVCPYMGVFDGQGHSIKNMQILNYTTHCQGLFGNVAGTHPGGHAQLRNFSVSGTMTSSSSGLKYVAGVVGLCNYVADLTNVTNNVNITLAAGTTQSYIGGVAGYCSRTNMQRCVNNGNIDAGASWECIAGLQAYATGYSATDNCLNTGNLTSTADNAYIAGMFGYQNNSKFQGAANCLNTGTITGGTANTNAGAIYGRYNSSVAVNRKGYNNYYLATSAAKAVGNNPNAVDDLTDVCTAVSANQLASGKTCYLLNSGNTTSPVWRQTLSESTMPQLSGEVVYYDTNMVPFYYNEGTQRHQPVGVNGDVEGDGKVTLGDLTRLINILGGKTTDTYGNADVDGDDKVGNEDVDALRDKILGK